jgi:hypothetical protein
MDVTLISQSADIGSGILHRIAPTLLIHRLEKNNETYNNFGVDARPQVFSGSDLFGNPKRDKIKINLSYYPAVPLEKAYSELKRVREGNSSILQEEQYREISFKPELPKICSDIDGNWTIDKYYYLLCELCEEKGIKKEDLASLKNDTSVYVMMAKYIGSQSEADDAIRGFADKIETPSEFQFAPYRSVIHDEPVMQDSSSIPYVHIRKKFDTFSLDALSEFLANVRKFDTGVLYRKVDSVTKATRVEREHSISIAIRAPIMLDGKLRAIGYSFDRFDLMH